MIEKYLIPLAIAALSTMFGSLITEVIKKRILLPGLIINWLVGVILFLILIKLRVYTLDLKDGAIMTLTVLGWNVAYNKNLANLKRTIRKWAKEKRQSKKGWIE